MNPNAPKANRDLLEKRKLLIEKRLSSLKKNDRIKPRNHQQVVALSFAQQRLWFLDQLLPNTPLYNIFSALHFPTPINQSVLHKSLQEIVRRHEALRTHFVLHQGEPVQVIVDEVFIPLPVIDISHHDEGRAAMELQQIVTREAQKPFQLAGGPLLRTTLVKQSTNDYFFLLSMHHIITDGWSMTIFFKELAVLYEAFSQGLPSPLNELQIQYADYALWQRKWLQGKNLQLQLDYWKQKLSGFSTHQIPTDYPRASVQTFNGTIKNFEFPTFFSKALKKVCQEEGVTMFMVLLAILNVLIFRLTGQTDLMVGSPISGRTRTELENIIGFFVNTLVFRTQFESSDTFPLILKKVKQTALEAFSHQDLPFEMLVEQLQPERNLSRNPLFQVMFQVLSNPSPTSDKDQFPEVDTASSKFDLTVSFNDYSHQLNGSIEYNTDLFRATTIDRFIEMYKILIQQIVEAPDTPVRELLLVSITDRQLVRQKVLSTETAYPRESSLAALFYQVAAQHADKTACIYPQESISYGDLDRRSNQFANYLLTDFKLAPETSVGLCLERSVDFIVAMLGIIKAGACYLPLDLDYPQNRLAFMIDDAQAAVVITKTRHAPLFSDLEVPLFFLDRNHREIEEQSPAKPVAVLNPEMLAYIMYTSGSTGQPKGIGIPQRGIVRLVCETNYIRIRPEDVLAQASNTSFDASTFEIWGTLLHGATMVGIEKTTSIAPKEYFQKIEQYGINTMFLTTALLNQFAQQAPWAFRSLDQVLFGGEAVTPKWVQEILQNSPLQRLLHVYGPTESTTFATWQQVKQVPTSATTIPIGQAISNTHTYILDPYLELVPRGTPGELYIGGDGLARGYVNHPGLTAAHFVPDPFSSKPGARMYRTKDLVKADESGNIIFIGRVDNQVKLRGFRIELGEIESHLKAIDSVKEAIVVLKETEKGERRLVGYLLLSDFSDFSLEALKMQLKGRIPEYMIPAAFVLLDHLPITPNGKVDHQKLPEPEPDMASSESKQSVKASTKTQKVISETWKEVLDLEEVSIHDNFFDIGGHSLLIAQVNNRLQERFQREIPLIDLFQYPTISALSAQLEATVSSGEIVENKKLDHIQQRISKQKRALQLNKKNRKRFR